MCRRRRVNVTRLLGRGRVAIPLPRIGRQLAANAFEEFYRQFGGKMRVLLTGMAPIKHEVAKFFDMMQLPLCESYGLVETGSLTYRGALLACGCSHLLVLSSSTARSGSLALSCSAAGSAQRRGRSLLLRLALVPRCPHLRRLTPGPWRSPFRRLTPMPWCSL